MKSSNPYTQRTNFKTEMNSQKKQDNSAKDYLLKSYVSGLHI